MSGLVGCQGSAAKTAKESLLAGSSLVFYTSPGDLPVSWAANHERDVNQAGGGYRIYYSQTKGATLAASTAIQVPYASGGSAPTAGVLPGLSKGVYYVRVVAYGAYGESSPSGEMTVVVK
jgi:hypothetical protein